MIDKRRQDEEQNPDASAPQRQEAEAILQIARAQRGMMWMFLLKVAMDFTFNGAAAIWAGPALIAYYVLYAVVSITIATFASRLANAIYGSGPAAVCFLLTASPCAGTLTVLVLNGNVMDHLRKTGVKSGFLGVAKREFEQLRQRAGDAAAQADSSNQPES